MRILYTMLFYLFLPLVLLRLYWRGFKAPEYRKRCLERLAIYKTTMPDNVIWIHAVSVGEAEAVFPLVRQLQDHYSSDKFLVTTTTPTGSARVQAVLGDQVSHVYLPYDLPYVVKRFLAVFKPKIAIIMEKEIWPNLYRQCAADQIPIMIINARLSANSAKGYIKIPTLMQPALACVSWITTQTDDDKTRFIEIGAKAGSIVKVGNLKFDLDIDNELIQQALTIKQQYFANRFIWIIASTHANEESIFLELYPQLKRQIPELLLVIVPRHPERFDTVKQLAEKMQFHTCMRSTGELCRPKTDVYIADTMGELKLLYGVADVCFVGGSMVPVGGHNILEPAAMKVPIMFGPHMINFKQMAENILVIKGAVQCVSNEQTVEHLLSLYNSPDDRYKLTVKASEFLKQNQGATDKTMLVIEKFINTQ